MRLAQLATCPHQQLFPKYYPQNAVVFRNICDKNAVNQGFSALYQLPMPQDSGTAAPSGLLLFKGRLIELAQHDL